MLGRSPADVWEVSHPIVGLSAPAYYRLRVSFRWSGYDRRPAAEEVLLTPVCHQLELRPDLAVASLAVSVASEPGQDAYVATVLNGRRLRPGRQHAGAALSVTAAARERRLTRRYTW